MAYIPSGVQAMFPVLLPRRAQQSEPEDAYDTMVAQNENSLNQNFSILYQKLNEMEEKLTNA